jgi:hypothetical protein
MTLNIEYNIPLKCKIHYDADAKNITSHQSTQYNDSMCTLCNLYECPRWIFSKPYRVMSNVLMCFLIRKTGMEVIMYSHKLN